MRVAVVGPGAIGTTVAAALHSTGATPLLCGRSPRAALQLHLHDGSVTVPGPVLTDPTRVEPVDLAFLSVKATQTEGAAGWLAALVDEKTVVCVLQNGVEQVAAVGPLAPEATVLPAVVWFPAEAQPDGSVRLRGGARLTLPQHPASEVVLDALGGSWCEAQVVDDFTSVAWRKLLQNALAGLMAVTGRRSGVFARDDIAELSLAYLAECLTVARAEGAQLGDDVPDQILAEFRGYPSDMGTSILADREAGRPLEWKIRNGVIQRLGRLHGIPTPVSDVVVPLLAATSEGPG